MLRKAPTFDEAQNLRQKVRAAGLSPDHWYAAEYSNAVRRGKVVEVSFAGSSMALFRGDDGRVSAIENRCAHRQIKLSLGQVNGCQLTCQYHGWTYNRDGQVTEIPHDLFGHKMPNFRVRAYPVKERYGLIWVFPGSPERAAECSMPEVPEMEGSNPWAYVPQSFTWKSHHSMVIDNLCDLTHAYLHRQFPSFLPGRLLGVEQQDQRVVMRYEAKVGPFAHKRWANPRCLEICYDYPYHWARFEWSNIEGKIKYWTFLLPIDDHNTRLFFLFCYDRMKFPWLPWRVGHRWIRLALRMSDPVIRSLLDQDGQALAAEQAGYDSSFESPLIELNPVVTQLHQLTVRKWEEYLSRNKTQQHEVPA